MLLSGGSPVDSFPIYRWTPALYLIFDFPTGLLPGIPKPCCSDYPWCHSWLEGASSLPWPTFFLGPVGSGPLGIDPCRGMRKTLPAVALRQVFETTPLLSLKGPAGRSSDDSVVDVPLTGDFASRSWQVCRLACETIYRYLFDLPPAAI